MTTQQFLIFAVFLIGYIYSIFRRLEKYDENRLHIFFEFLIFFFVYTIAISQTIEKNRLKKIHKCPELEKVENVYRLKK